MLFLKLSFSASRSHSLPRTKPAPFPAPNTHFPHPARTTTHPTAKIGSPSPHYKKHSPFPVPNTHSPHPAHTPTHPPAKTGSHPPHIDVNLSNLDTWGRVYFVHFLDILNTSPCVQNCKIYRYLSLRFFFFLKSFLALAIFPKTLLFAYISYPIFLLRSPRSHSIYRRFSLQFGHLETCLFCPFFGHFKHVPKCPK